MLIIEGPDMVGKTTIARKLVEVFDRTVQYDKFGLIEADYVGIRPWLDRYQPNKICDRFAISEFVYGLICRGKANLSPDQWSEMQSIMQLAGMRVMLVSCHPKAYAELLEKRYDPAREAFSKQQCQEVSEAYYALARDGFWRGYKMNATVMEVDVVDGQVINADPWSVGMMVGDWIHGIPARSVMHAMGQYDAWLAQMKEKA